MPLHDCPGPDRKQQAVPEDVTCPACGAEVEMWTNESKVTCPSCGQEITRDQPEAGG